MLTEMSINGCAYLFKVWNDEMQEKRICKTDEEKLQNVENMMNMGLRLSKLTKKANSCLSPFLLFDMFIFLVSFKSQQAE